MNIKAPYFKIETFGAVDGPGVRLVIFLQGCPLRCIYCHNPESWNDENSLYISPQEVVDKFKKNLKFYQHGGITLSGGEPLIHKQFCLELAKLCHSENISLALDTSGATFTSENLFFFHKIIKHNLLWIIDIKHINPQKHKLITGIKKQNELSLINFLEKNKKPYWIRQVILPGYTDDPKDLRKLGTFIKSLKWLKNFELLPYHRLAIDKYKALNIHSLTTQIKEPTKQMMAKAKGIIIGN